MTVDAPGAWAPSGTTQLAAVIGDPVRHSLSPLLHNAAFRHLGMDWVYAAFPVATGHGAEAVAAMRVLGIGGLSVTMPHKEDAAGAVDALTDDGAVLGSVNTVFWRDGRVWGDATDGSGFVDSVRERNVVVDGSDVLVIGAGGAARAVVLALVRAGASVTVSNRTAGKAEALVAMVNDATGTHGAATVGTTDHVDRCALVVNATSVGMIGTSAATDGGTAALPIDPARLGPGQVVCDLIYHPLVTPLLAAADAKGAVTIDGTAMLLHQAGRQFTLWTGEPAPIDVMRAALASELARRSAVGPS